MLGAVLLVLGFGLAVTPTPVTVGGATQRCDPVLDLGALVGDRRDPVASPAALTAADRRQARAAVACLRAEQRAGWASWGGLSLGALLLLVGWTASRKNEATGRSDVRVDA